MNRREGETIGDENPQDHLSTTQRTVSGAHRASMKWSLSGMMQDLTDIVPLAATDDGGTFFQ